MCWWSWPGVTIVCTMLSVVSWTHKSWLSNTLYRMKSIINVIFIYPKVLFTPLELKDEDSIRRAVAHSNIVINLVTIILIFAVRLSVNFSFSWVGPGKPGTTPLRMWTSLDRRGLPKFARRWGCRGLCICPTLMPGRSQRSPSSREGAGSWPPSTRVSWRSRQSSPRQPSSGSATKQIYAINLIKVLWCVRWVGQLHQLLVLKVEET